MYLKWMEMADTGFYGDKQRGLVMEKWDAYTRNGNLANKVLIRGEEIPNGLYHLACEVY